MWIKWSLLSTKILLICLRPDSRVGRGVVPSSAGYDSQVSKLKKWVDFLTKAIYMLWYVILQRKFHCAQITIQNFSHQGRINCCERLSLGGINEISMETFSMWSRVTSYLCGGNILKSRKSPVMSRVEASLWTSTFRTGIDLVRSNRTLFAVD